MHTASHMKAKCRETGSIEHVCDRGKCGKRFDTDAKLQIHLSMHDNILYRCHFCTWTGVLAEHSGVARHFNSHFGIRPHLCSLCDAKFYKASARAQHERCVHEKIQYVRRCGSCDFETLSLAAYNKHKGICDKRKMD